MKNLLLHYRIRLFTISKQPEAVLTFLGTGLGSLMIWPFPLKSITFGNEGLTLLVWMLWIWLITIGVSRCSAGYEDGRLSSRFKGFGAYPALPISIKTRAFADAMLAVSLTTLIRIPLYFPCHANFWLAKLPGLESTQSFSSYLVASVIGALVLLPIAIAWCSPSRTMEGNFLRPIPYIAVLAFAQTTDLHDSIPVASILSLLLTIIATATSDRDFDPVGFWDKLNVLSGRTYSPRPARHPILQFRRDLWIKPLGWFMVLFGVGCTIGVAFSLGVLPEAATSLSLGVVGGFMISLVCLRPLGSNLALAGLFRKHGYRPGDLGRALAILPIPRKVVIRGIFLHGFIFSLLMWGGVMTLRLGLNYLATGGVFSELRTDRIFLALFVPLLILTPTVGSLLVTTTVGNMGRAYSCLVILNVYFFGYPLFRLMPPILHAAVDIILAGVGAWLSVEYLREDRSR